MWIKSTMYALAISTTGLLPGDEPRPVIGIWDVLGGLAIVGVVVLVWVVISRMRKWDSGGSSD